MDASFDLTGANGYQSIFNGGLTSLHVGTTFGLGVLKDYTKMKLGAPFENMNTQGQIIGAFYTRSVDAAGDAVNNSVIGKIDNLNSQKK